MYRIALCDDETEELDKTETMLNIYHENHLEVDFKIDCFRNADELLHVIREKNYVPDLLLLDIYMPEKMGITAAKEIRSMGNKGRIIFLTASKEHALEAFGVEASQYLVKPIQEKKLFSVLDKILEEIEEERKRYLLLKIDNRIHRIAIHDIVYCEAQKKNQLIYFADGTQSRLRMTMKEIWEMLSCYQEFVKVGISYIINLEHLNSLNAKEMKMDSGKTIFLPRGSYQPLREKYFQYYCGEEP